MPNLIPAPSLATLTRAFFAIRTEFVRIAPDFAADFAHCPSKRENLMFDIRYMADRLVYTDDEIATLIARADR